MRAKRSRSRSRASTIVILVAAVIVFGLWQLAARLRTPTIAVTSPAGGEKWHPGEEHVISWTARNVPATRKISVTIRRIPPPPLAEEGQEFDPIVFVNLPNTGSVDWTIDPMYPDGTYVLRVSAYESIPITDEVAAESKEFTITKP